jgi:phage gp16-like protein
VTAQPPDRKAMIAKIHIAKAQLGLEEDDYRATIERITGKRSSAECSAVELDSVLREFRRHGYRPRRVSDKPDIRKLHALWRELAAMGRVTSASPEALAAWVQRMTKTAKRPQGLSSPEWLSPAEARTLIEALKQWIARP